jgi:HD superfamily phosphodiesterase
MNPTYKKKDSYVKDTTHFLELINDNGALPDNVIVATLDVTALYTNIPTRERILAAARALNLSRPGNVRPSNNSLIKLLKLVLNRNNFKFNGRHFLQIKGTAIGTMVAPGFANNHVAWFERMFVYLYKHQPLL